MPPKKTQANRVSSYFAPAESRDVGSDSTASAGMEHTKEDFLSSLRDFKKKLREELKGDMAISMEALRSDINSRLTTLQQDVDSVGSRTLDLEAKMQDLDQRTMCLEGSKGTL